MEKPHAQTDNSLIKALKTGNQEAIGKFYLERKAAFINWAEKHFYCRHVEAIDVYQDTVITVYENIVSGKFQQQTDSSLTTYLFAVGKNIFLKKLHKEKKTKDRIIAEATWHAGEDTKQKERRMIEDERKHDAITQAFAVMKEPCKSILKHFYYQGLTMKEIAAKLGYKSGQVVKSQKVRCLQALKAYALKNLDR